MNSQTSPHHHHSRYVRFYLVMITLVLGGIIFLLALNNNNSVGGFSLTGSSVGIFENNSVEKNTDALAKILPKDQSKAKNTDSLAKEVSTSLTFTQIPAINQEVDVEEIELSFSNVNADTKIKINNDLLELNQLDDVNVRISGFMGRLTADASALSLDGVAKSIKVNGLTLSSQAELGLQLDNVNYNFFAVQEIQFHNLNLPAGNGVVKAADKFSYNLEQEGLVFPYFSGKLTIDHNSALPLTLEGVSQGVNVKGALLDINLQ